MKKTLRIAAVVLKTILGLLMGLLLIYNVYMLTARYAFGNSMPTIFGFGGAIVASGSMEPTLEINDFIVTKAQEEYEIGDIIMFYDKTRGEYVTHRVILVSGEIYATKGDNNNIPDDYSVPKSAVVGKVVSIWSGFGGLIRFLQSPAGFFTIVGGGLIIWIATDLLGGRKGKEKNEREREKN